MTHCDHCGADTTNGLTLCDTCRTAVTVHLEFLPIYYRNLDRQRRPGRPNGSLNSSWLLRAGETQGSPVQTALTRATTTLAEAVASTTTTPPQGDTDADTFALLAEHLEANLHRVDQPGRLVRDITRHEHTLRALTEHVVPGWYAGTCRQPAGRDLEGNHHTCGANTYVVPGLTWVTCPRCGTTTHAADHVDVVLDEAADWIAPPMQIATALVLLLEHEHSATRLYRRIKIWAERGHITGIRTRVDADGDPTGPRLYRLGDIHARLHVEGPSIDIDQVYRQLVERITGETTSQRAYRLRRAHITGHAA